MNKKEFTKYEKARIIGARALQISMNAPILIKLTKEELEDLNYDSIKIAEKELEEGVLPISVERPMPIKIEEEIDKIEKEKLIKEAQKEILVEEENIPELEEVEEIEEESSKNED
ncbi:MAG: DNA-directed RNA polymerase subunit K [Candidatus Pacearchaeota archaeon]